MKRFFRSLLCPVNRYLDKRQVFVPWCMGTCDRFLGLHLLNANSAKLIKEKRVRLYIPRRGGDPAFGQRASLVNFTKFTELTGQGEKYFLFWTRTINLFYADDIHVFLIVLWNVDHVCVITFWLNWNMQNLALRLTGALPSPDIGRAR